MHSIWMTSCKPTCRNAPLKPSQMFRRLVENRTCTTCPLQTDAFVLLKRPPADSFQSFNVFSAEHGALLILQRVAKKSANTSVALDLFDEASLDLESSKGRDAVLSA